MRNKITHFWTAEQTYEIREIVEVWNKIEEFWVDMIWENIWDPVSKWEHIPDWLKKIIKDNIDKDDSFAYSPSKGVLETRKYLAEKNWKISAENIIFFNWLWEAINKIYWYLSIQARVLWPNPAYPTHSSSEATNSWSFHMTYNLYPDNNWSPNLEEIENKVKYNPNISAILVVNPDNPTGIVFDKEILEWIIEIAKKYELFVIFDEIYDKLTYEEKDHISLKDIIWDVPWIAMKWLSKEVPWPWSRCGRIEVYNQDKDEEFAKYIKSVYFSKMLEVCSTTLPQKVLPEIYESPNFKELLVQRIEKYKKRADIVEEILWDLDLITYVKPKWAFYFSIIFNDEKFPDNPSLKIENSNLKGYIEWITSNVRFDKKFCYYTMAAYGICVVPLSWFNSTYQWFRMTLLEEDIEKFKYIVETLKKAIIEFSEEK